MAETEVKLPWSLRYPIMIVEKLVQPGTEIQKNTPLFTYRYPARVVETRGLDEEVEVTRELLAVFEAPMEGTLGEWTANEGDKIEAAGIAVVTVVEPCTHAVQYAGMCALCGKDLTFQDYSGYKDSARADVKMFHKTTGLAVSMTEAQRIEKTTTLALLASRKLILVVDLDQTVIHTTADPTIGQWLNDPSNIHHESVKNVHSFCLKDGGPTAPAFWYYVKIRPGLTDFLKHISQLYELHIYTMATKSYAEAIARIIDPDGVYFGDRVLTRDESGNLEQKNLKRLFPVDTSLVAIIDDRGDVWKWSANLIKVIPYEFFVGTGDINSKFLPKRVDVKASSAVDAPLRLAISDDENNSSVEQVAAKAKQALQSAAPAASTSAVGSRKRKRRNSNSTDWRAGLPDVKVIMPRMKKDVLENVVILFSGLIPIGVKMDSVDLVIWARSFGALVVDTLAFDVTHLVAEKAGTEKVHQAQKFNAIKIVKPAWLYQCLSTWTRVDEGPYMLPLSPCSAWEDTRSDSSSDLEDILKQMEDEDDEDDEEMDEGRYDEEEGRYDEEEMPVESNPSTEDKSEDGNRIEDDESEDEG
ncbi:HAD-like domain-containing protein [Limtongia smithiae]|uniref:HAD-like domain-containing protein n=1 Tax=Limtongia smithiae TaxID=1125753 RepID=UPI0034CDD70B